MKKIRFPVGLFITGATLFFLLAACDAAGSLAGDRDTIWQTVKESSSYTVSFDTNGGDPVPRSQTVHYGGKAVNPDNTVEKKDFIFKGWFKQPECTNEWDFSADTVTGNTTLYVKWDETAGHAVSFSVYTAKAPVYGQDVPDGGLIIQPDSPERDGWIFDQWYEDQAYTTPWDFAVDTVTSDMTLYGTWKQLLAGQNAVRFKAAGGSPVPADQAVSNNGKVSDPQMEPTKDQHTFGGWYRDTACTLPWLFDIDAVSGETSIYAQWNEEGFYTVNFYTDGGTPTPVQQFLVLNSPVTKPDDPVKTGYTFDRWYWFNSFDNENVEWTFETNKIPGNLTLYATWQPITYTVRFYANDGSGSGNFSDENFKYGDEKPLSANGFTCTGYTFTGWNTQADGKGKSYTNNANVKNLSDTNGDTFSLYAQWKINQYTVTFASNGGNPVPSSQTVDYGTKVTRPTDPVKEYTDVFPVTLPAGLYRLNLFEGWYSDADYTTEWNFDNDSVPDRNITLYAKWGDQSAVSLPGISDIVSEAVTYINANPAAYTLLLGNDVPATPVQNLNVSGVSLTLLGKDSERTINLSGNGSLFTVGSGVTLVLGDKVTLKGHDGNNKSLVDVEAGGKLIMNGSAKISGNTTSGNGGGVYVNGGSLTMSGEACISDNTATEPGGGVYVIGGSFTINGTACVSGNSAANSGGGVFMIGGTLNMSGEATISNNKGSYDGGGVLVGGNSSFTMSDEATISYNTNAHDGGGVFVDGNSSFTMSDKATISYNANAHDGGGVCVFSSSFTMNGGYIINNDIGATGGGVFINGGSFSMNSGEIHNNHATTFFGGGGVMVYSYADGSSYFSMSGGKIYNNDASNGGGVYVMKDGTGSGQSYFTMTGGEILSNSASGDGGGLIVAGGSNFSMSGEAIISGNTASAYGGGVCLVNSGIFTMDGGTIGSPNSVEGNSAQDGGGVHVGTGSIFTMNGGKITGNTALSSSFGGGGVHVYDPGTCFTMNDGEISGNIASIYGGGVYVGSSATFAMHSGTISGNIASVEGGGVRVGAMSINLFIKDGGTITGYGSYVSGDKSSFNVVGTLDTPISNKGHAVWVDSTPPMRLETTAGPTVNINSVTGEGLTN